MTKQLAGIAEIDDMLKVMQIDELFGLSRRLKHVMQMSKEVT